MPEFTEINDQLGELESELSKLKTAVDEIDEAKESTRQVITACSTIQGVCKRLMEETQKSHDAVRKTAENLMYTLDTATKRILGNTEETLKHIEQSNQQVREQILETLKTFQEIDFPSGLANIKNILQTCDVIASRADVISVKVDETLRAIETSKQDINNHVSETLQIIREIDFPKHFDKLDTAISGINIGIQNIIQICSTTASKVESENQETRNRMEHHYGMLRAATKFNRNLLFVAILLSLGAIIAHFVR